MRTGFHAHDGWYFRRSDGATDGVVVIEVAESAQQDAPLKVAAGFDPDTWASIVASVSAAGESGPTWNAARRLHMAGPTSTEVQVQARRAYDAYGDHAGWANYRGERMPAWDDLGEAIRSHWVAAAGTLLGYQEGT
jgi:hypothetical protein